MDKYIGKKLDGRYTIEELVGVGGMANVYRAYDVIEDRVVAVKILRDEYMENEEFLRRFRNESKAIAMLSHPNIVKVYDICFLDHMQSMVMEYLDGITLKEYIENLGKISWKEAVYFTVQILRGLQHVHDKGIVHRDIKPQNIMLASDGTIKIMDFGIARFARSAVNTITDKAIGSVHYISPEQATGDKVDARTDIYSVGVMLYEMLTGQVPFEADSPVSVALKQIQSSAPRPRELNPEIPEGLEEIIIRAMQKDKNQRYQSAAEMLRDIEEFKRDPSISFEYKYLTEPLAEEIPKEVAKTMAVKKPEKKSEKQPKAKREKVSVSLLSRLKRSAKGMFSEGEDGEDKPSFLPVLAGITAGFVIVAVLFILILFFISQPFKKVEEFPMPNLMGQRYEDVKNNAEYAKKFKISVEEQVYNDEYPAGTICNQSPNADRKIKKGTTVKVKVSLGSKTATLPDYTNQEASTVYKDLKDRGLSWEEFTVYSDTVDAGRVTKTDPAGGGEISTSTKVTVYVSQGPQEKTTRVPSLAGLTLEDAKTLLKSYKLNVGKITIVSSNLPEGQVVDQSPRSEEKVDLYSSVDLDISDGTIGNGDDDEE